ncbi:NACHT, LRR and PYD domains-containing protein 3-like isoform X2 [Engraulis encrasicolus]|uniref:NACHT, LRR and PYD domains-containing protein 3-like isoform X2 n=1 Tax=Engraulis encrasicolus TaxID=184585 RepID=UPI002FD56BEC
MDPARNADLKHRLRLTLDDLGEDDFKRFKHLLRDEGRIPCRQLEKADTNDTVDLMVQVYTSEAGNIALSTLQKMNQKQLADRLSGYLRGEGAVDLACAQSPPSVSGGRMGERSLPQPGGAAKVVVTATAETGGVNNVPVLHDCIINAPVTVVCGSSSHAFNENNEKTTVPESGRGDAEMKRHLKMQLKESLKRFSVIHQETRDRKLEDVYTELYIVEGRTGGVSSDHEVTTINAKQKRENSPAKPLSLKEMFSGEGSKTVITVGIAGVGKTIAVQKFVTDWAEDKSHKDIDFVFLFLFRELNTEDGKFYSLYGLITRFYTTLYTKIEDLRDLFEYSKCKILFIFDGWDESRLHVNFDNWISDPNEESSVAMLVASLIKGKLLPSALIWVTTRPAATHLIPRECFNMVTEVRGFKDEQKDEFFRKNISDPKKAEKVIKHLQNNRSLYIMCHIPVFCHIISIVLHDILDNHSEEQTPKTLTQVYTSFSLGQINKMEEKYLKEMTEEEKGEFLIKLGKLAFKHLEENIRGGTIIFYEKDLKQCDIDTKSGALESGVCTQIFKDETSFTNQRIFSFVHLSVQEFFAALYALCKGVNGENPLTKTTTQSVSDLYQSAVNEALQSPNGHLDLFVRFLLGLASVEEGAGFQLRDLLPQLDVPKETRLSTRKTTVDHIKEVIRKQNSAERTINLFHCLNELGDNSLVEEINRYRDSADMKGELTPAQCSALAYLLLMSSDDLDEFDQKKYLRSEEGFNRMKPVVKISKRVWLNQCHLSKASCELMVSVLQGTSSLRELDMSDNDLQDEGVELLCKGLEHTDCKLEVLRLSFCCITHKGCSLLASALKSNPSYLKDLDISYNHPEDSGIGELTDRRNDPNCKLETLKYEHGGELRTKPAPKKYAFELTLDPNTAHKQLSLSAGNRTVTRSTEDQWHPDQSDRFVSVRQVLCGEGLSGRCYWEAEWDGDEAVIAVAYKSIKRDGKGDESWFGGNDKSWCLTYRAKSFSVRHDNNTTDIPDPSPLSTRVGVYLDWPAGTLSFYSASNDTLTHLHTFDSTFTEPLYPGFGSIACDSSLSLCQIT